MQVCNVRHSDCVVLWVAYQCATGALSWEVKGVRWLGPCRAQIHGRALLTQSARLGVVDDVPRPARVRDFLVCLSSNLFVDEVQDVVARLLLEHPWSPFLYYGNSAVVNNIIQVGHVVQKVLGASVGTARGCLVALGGLVFSPRWVGKVQKGGLAAIMLIRVLQTRCRSSSFSFVGINSASRYCSVAVLSMVKDGKSQIGICEHKGNI